MGLHMDVTNDQYGFTPSEARQLYKLHTRAGRSEESDSDSFLENEDIPHNKILDKISLDEIKPPIIDYDAIMKKSQPVSSLATRSTVDDNANVKPIINIETGKDPGTDIITERQLQVLTPANYCYLCRAQLDNQLNSISHYSSKRHTAKANTWIRKFQKLQILEYSQNAGQINKQSSVRSSNNVDDSHSTNSSIAQRIIEEKLQLKTALDYCSICSVDLRPPTNSKQHYNSKKHKTNIDNWKKEEKMKLKNPPNLETPSNSRSHYNSKRHEENVRNWKNQEREKLAVLGNSDKVANVDMKHKTKKKAAKALAGIAVKKPVNAKHEPQNEEIIKKKNNQVNVDLANDSKTIGRKITEPAKKTSRSVRCLIAAKCLPDNCSLCDVAFNTIEIANQHYESKMHKIKQDHFSYVESNIIRYGANKFEKTVNSQILSDNCLICNMSFESSLCADLHYKSSSHQDNLLLWKEKELQLIKDDNLTSKHSDTSNRKLQTERSKKAENNLVMSDVTIVSNFKSNVIGEEKTVKRPVGDNYSAKLLTIEPQLTECYLSANAPLHPDSNIKQNATKISKSSSTTDHNKHSENITDATEKLQRQVVNRLDIESCAMSPNDTKQKIQKELDEFRHHINSFTDRCSILLSSEEWEELHQFLLSYNCKLKNVNDQYKEKGKTDNVNKLEVPLNIVRGDDEILKPAFSVNKIKDFVASNGSLATFIACAAIFWIYVLCNCNIPTVIAIQIIILFYKYLTNKSKYI